MSALVAQESKGLTAYNKLNGVVPTLVGNWVEAPAQRVGDLLTYINSHTAGPRETAEIAQLMKTAEGRLPKAAPPTHELQTMYRTQHTEQDMTGVKRGGRIMRNQDGGAVHRDADFLAETYTLPRDVADRYARPAADKTAAMRTARLPEGAPVTVQAEAMAKGKYGEAHFGTKRFGVPTFGKHSNFSKPIGDWSKDASDE